ncbi:MAG: ABC transporter permease, partial [Lachnospiraceae bacterium]|nr:ABC transporter permease [Lachnospiraceae bacterium]
MKKRKMYIRMITASLLRRRSRMIIALLAISIGAMILSGLVTIYIDVPRQMGIQFRSYGANMILTSDGDTISGSQVEAVKKLIPEDKLVGIAAYRYETVRVNDRPVMAAAADLDEVKKTSPFWLVDGEWPAAEGEIMVGKNVADLYNLKVGKRMTCTFAPEVQTQTEDDGTEEIVPDNWMDFTVTGILDTGGKEEDYVYMLIPDMEELTSQPTEYDVCELSVSGSSSELKKISDEITDSVDGISARLVKRVTESEDTVLSKLQSLVLLVTIVVLALT